MVPQTVSKSRQKSSRDRTSRRPVAGAAPATAQLQAQTQATPAVSQNVTVETSVQLVQTLTQACVSSLAKLRHMFNEDNYESRRVNVSDAVTSGAAKASDDVEKAPILLQFSTLKRGVTSRADLLLDWVEKGAGEAIEKGCLKCLRFAIYEDEARPDDRLEEWVLSFNYHTDVATGHRVVSSMSLAEKIQDKSITVSQARRALGRFIADLAHVCTECLPELPATVRLIVELDMNDHRPSDYCPAGFGGYVAGAPRFADTEDWECQSRSVTRMNAGFHDVKLKVNYLAARHDDAPSAVPPGLPCTKTLSREGDSEVGLTSSAPASFRSGEQPDGEGASRVSQALSKHATEDASMDANAGTSSVTSAHGRRKQPTRSSSLANAPSAPPRRASDDLRVREQIGRMLPPASSNTKLPDTQSNDVDSPVQETVVEGQLVFLSSKVEELVSNHFPKPPPNGKPNVVRAGQSTEEVITIRCDCGSQDIEGSMVGCQFCDRYQHMHCLGYHAANEGRVPSPHICPRCLLTGESTHNLNAMGEMALCRRTIFWLQTNGFENIRELAKKLALKEAVCSRIVKRLKQEGALTTSGHLYTSSEGRATMLKAFFDPAKGISHHLETSSQMREQHVRQLDDAKSKRKRGHEDTGHMAGPRAKVYDSSFRPSAGICTGDYSTPKAARRR
ncbi:HORMA domain-containing protein [Ampelomyces quisqualis]|uniref:HORMA domain-containing protein n=1 Tax=Ampelomyces quisqualis TaxID=50730 RepID=A0A6A5Q5E9_AMPQU|nr:HORMA domain-containing protein [Ampelomyces quisqualis]